MAPYLPLLVPVSSIDAVIALQRAGFTVTSQGPEHVVMERADRRVVIRRKRVLQPPELMLILHVARISADEFLKLLAPAPRFASGVRAKVSSEDEPAQDTAAKRRF